jgi:hypothetical protein
MCPKYNRAWSVPMWLISNLHSISKLVKSVQNYIVSLTLQGSCLWILEMMRTRHLHQQDQGGLNLMTHAPSIFQHAFSDTLRYCVLLQSKKKPIFMQSKQGKCHIPSMFNSSEKSGGFWDEQFFSEHATLSSAIRKKHSIPGTAAIGPT